VVVEIVSVKMQEVVGAEGVVPVGDAEERAGMEERVVVEVLDS